MEFALEAHKGQTRKGKITPYYFHLYLVNSVLHSLTDDENILATGWLHDTVEDTVVTIEDIQHNFNAEIYSYVSVESEDKSIKDWKTRKDLQIAKFQEIAQDKNLRKVLLVAFADKMANLMEIYQDYLIIGEDIWNRFNVKDKKQQQWYYTEFHKLFIANDDLFVKNQEILNNYGKLMKNLFD